MANRLFTVPETLDHLRLGRTKFYELVESGEIRLTRVGRRSYVSETEIDRFIEASTVGAGAVEGR